MYQNGDIYRILSSLYCCKLFLTIAKNVLIVGLTLMIQGLA